MFLREGQYHEDSDDLSPSLLLEMLQLRQELLGLSYHSYEDEMQAEDLVDTSRTRWSSLHEIGYPQGLHMCDWLSKSFPEHKEVVELLFDRQLTESQIHMGFSCDRVHSPKEADHRSDGSHVVLRIRMDSSDRTADRLVCGFAVETEGHDRDGAGLYVSRTFAMRLAQQMGEFSSLLEPLVRLNGDGQLFAHLNICLHAFVKSWDLKQGEDLAGRIRSASSPVELLAECLAFIESRCDLSEDQRERLTILKIAYGVAPLAEIRERLSLFKALEMLGIRVVGGAPREYLGEGAICHPLLSDGLDYSFLAPGQKELQALRRDWSEYEPRLTVQTRFVYSLFLCLAAPGAMSWRPDRSVSNLSSVSMLVRDGAHVLLSGDALHSTVMKALRRHASCSNVPAQKLYYQIPHHGSWRTTSVHKDLTPRELLGAGSDIAAAFAVGGTKPGSPSNGIERPHPCVLAFHKRGARRVVAVNDHLSSAAGHTFYDIRL